MLCCVEQCINKIDIFEQLSFHIRINYQMVNFPAENVNVEFKLRENVKRKETAEKRNKKKRKNIRK